MRNTILFSVALFLFCSCHKNNVEPVDLLTVSPWINSVDSTLIVAFSKKDSMTVSWPIFTPPTGTSYYKKLTNDTLFFPVDSSKIVAAPTKDSLTYILVRYNVRLKFYHLR